MGKNDIFSLATGKYIDEIPEGFVLMQERFERHTETPSVTQEQCCNQIPSLISSVRDLVNALTSDTGSATAIPEAFGVEEAAIKLGCSPGQVRKLVNDGKLGHHWLGKNLRFRQQDLEDFWAFQTRSGSDKTSSKLSRENDRKRSETKRPDPVALPPTRREVHKLWR